MLWAKVSGRGGVVAKLRPSSLSTVGKSGDDDKIANTTTTRGEGVEILTSSHVDRCFGVVRGVLEIFIVLDGWKWMDLLMLRWVGDYYERRQETGGSEVAFKKCSAAP